MSMLEDLFLEDEAGEAQELERVLEGGGEEYDERPVSPTSDDNEERDDEAVEDKRRVDPTKVKEKRVIKNPRFVLNPARLTGPRGIQVIPEHFKDFKLKGKGHEKEDLDMVLKKLEHWAYRLYPKFGFQDCLKKIEMLGKKRPVMVHLKQIRSDQFTSEETVVRKDSSDDEAPPEQDEFDKLLQQQIELARATPAPSSVKKTPFSTPSVDRSHIMPKATSSPSISDEQRERMIRNRQLAEERRLAKLRNDNSSFNINCTPEKHTTVENINEIVEIPDEVVVRKHNTSNVIDSSDEEDIGVVNESITVDVDVHNKNENIQHISNEDKDVIAANTEDVFDKVLTSENNRFSKDNNDKMIALDTDDLSKNENTEDNVEIIDKYSTCDRMDVTPIDNETRSSEDVFDNRITCNKECDDKLTKSNNETDKNYNLTESSNQSPIIEKDKGSQSPVQNPKSNIDNAEECNSIDNVKSTDNNETNTNNNDDITNLETNGTVSNDLKDKEALILSSNKENIDSNIADDVMDVDFSDDF